MYPGVGTFVLIRPTQTFYERIKVGVAVGLPPRAGSAVGVGVTSATKVGVAVGLPPRAGSAVGVGVRSATGVGVAVGLPRGGVVVGVDVASGTRVGVAVGLPRGGVVVGVDVASGTRVGVAVGLPRGASGVAVAVAVICTEGMAGGSAFTCPASKSGNTMLATATTAEAATTNPLAKLRFRAGPSHITRGTLKKCVNSQAVYPLSEQHGLEAQERRYTAHEEGKH